ncbi:MAG: glycosyltransferase, partial [Acidobacteria bacterium]|nr:glycosyltransferase [Acidobacteriota bacterium]
MASTSLDDVAVIIPALNEEASLPLVLRDLPAVGRVIVVDNGSSDNTADVA